MIKMMGKGMPIAHNNTERMKLSNKCRRDNPFAEQMFPTAYRRNS